MRRLPRYAAPLALIAAVALVGAAVSGTSATAAPGTKNHWGLKIITEAPTVPRDLPDDPYEAASVVAMYNPDDFGFPAVTDGVVELPAVSVAAISLTADDEPKRLQKLIDYSNNRPVKPGVEQPPTLDVSKGLSHVKVTAAPGKRTVTHLNALVDQLVDLDGDPAFADAGITSAGIGGDGKVILTVHELTDNLAKTIAERFGTEDIVVEVSDVVAVLG